MRNRTRERKPVQPAEPDSKRSAQLVAAAIRGAASGAFRSVTDWAIRVFTTH